MRVPIYVIRTPSSGLLTAAEAKRIPPDHAGIDLCSRYHTAKQVRMIPDMYRVYTAEKRRTFFFCVSVLVIQGRS